MVAGGRDFEAGRGGLGTSRTAHCRNMVADPLPHSRFANAEKLACLLESQEQRTKGAGK